MEGTWPSFARRGAANHLGAVVERRLRMKGAVLAGKALANDLGVLADEDGHYGRPFGSLPPLEKGRSAVAAERQRSEGGRVGIIADVRTSAIFAAMNSSTPVRF